MSNPVQDALVRLRKQLGAKLQSCLARDCNDEAVRGPGDVFKAGETKLIFCHYHWWDLSQEIRDEMESRWKRDHL